LQVSALFLLDHLHILPHQTIEQALCRPEQALFQPTPKGDREFVQIRERL
jgi:hypothetical protein